MISIDLRDDHGNIRSPPVCRVIGYNGCLEFGDLLFKSPDLILLHIDCAECEVDLLTILLYFISTVYDKILCIIRHRNIDLPSAFTGFFIPLAG